MNNIRRERLYGGNVLLTRIGIGVQSLQEARVDELDVPNLRFLHTKGEL